MSFAGQRSRDAFSLLIRFYSQNKDFMKEFESFVDNHRSVLELLASSLRWPNGPNPSMVQFDQLEQWASSLNDQTYLQLWEHRYADEKTNACGYMHPFLNQIRLAMTMATELSNRWGLKAGWGPGLIIQTATLSLKFPQPRFMPSVFWGGWTPRKKVDLSRLASVIPGEIPESAEIDATLVLITDNYDPTEESWKSFERRALQILRQQRREIEDIMKDIGREKAGGKTSLDDHVRWLYLAICPNTEKHRPLYYSEIADSISDEGESVLDENTISKAIGGKGGLASFLGINLPHARGRPPGMQNLDH